jgi:hypothetical protein
MRILVRQGEGPAAAYQRYHRELLEHERKVDRICEDVVSPPAASRLKRTAARSAEGDGKRLRGIPVFGFGGAQKVADDGSSLGFRDVDGGWCSAQELLCA